MKICKPQQMPTLRMLIFVTAFASLVMATNHTVAATIFESGTLGPTGIAQGSVAATNVTTGVFVGVRFQLAQPVVTTQVGGHFVGQGAFLGAIVDLDDETDFPDSEDLSTPDVLGTTAIAFPALSDEVYGNLSVLLDPGWYALVFGSGLFGTTGDGAAPRNNSDIGSPSYIGRPTTSGWLDLVPLSDIFVDHRFVVKGTIVPEPSAATLVCFDCVLGAHEKGHHI